MEKRDARRERTTAAKVPLVGELAELIPSMSRLLDVRIAFRLPIVIAGALLEIGRRTASRWFQSAGVKQDLDRFYDLLSSLGRATSSLMIPVIMQIIHRLDPGPAGRWKLAVDDSPTRRYGRHVEGANPVVGGCSPQCGLCVCVSIGNGRERRRCWLGARRIGAVLRWGFLTESCDASFREVVQAGRRPGRVAESRRRQIRGGLGFTGCHERLQHSPDGGGNQDRAMCAAVIAPHAPCRAFKSAHADHRVGGRARESWVFWEWHVRFYIDLISIGANNWAIGAAGFMAPGFGVDLWR